MVQVGALWFIGRSGGRWPAVWWARGRESNWWRGSGQKSWHEGFSGWANSDLPFWGGTLLGCCLGRIGRLVVLGAVGACCYGVHLVEALVVVGALVFQGLDLGLRGSDVGLNVLGAQHHLVVDTVRRFSAHAGVGCQVLP